MPIYEYECLTCGGHFEIVQKFSDKPKRKCEACGGRIKKLISASAFHLKGTGWYVTDYAAKAKAETPTPSDTPAKADTTPETTPKQAASESARAPSKAAKTTKTATGAATSTQAGD